MDLAGAFGQLLYHGLLDQGGLGGDGVVLHLRGGQVKLIGGLDVRNFLEHVHQLRKVEKLGKAGPGPVAGPLRGQLQSRDRLPEPGGPAVKVAHAHLLQAVILKVTLDGIHFGH